MIIMEGNAKFQLGASENEDVMSSGIKFTDPVNFILESQQRALVQNKVKALGPTSHNLNTRCPVQNH